MDATPVIAGRIASAQTLPFEMLDLIFTGLAQDARSLSQCSLVCKVWSNRARRQLFRTIVLAISHQNAIKEILRFLQNLRDSHWIRTVIYRGCWEPLRPLFLVTCLDMLPELESLVLDQVELSCDYHNVQVGPHRKFRLGTLDLRRVSFLTSHSMMDIICVFAEIDTIIAKVISLGGDSLVDVTTWAPSSLDVTKPTVLNLRATQDCAAGSITWLYKVLGTYISPGSLTSLDLACITRASVHSFCTWMSKDGSRITSLRLDLSSEGSLLNAKARRPAKHQNQTPGFGIDLQQLGLAALKSLTIVGAISLLVSEGRVARVFVWANLLAIIRSAPAGLTHLGIGFATTGTLDWVLGDGLDWEEFSRTISGFGGLQVISFSRRYADFSDKEISVIHAHIGRLRDRTPAVSLQFLRD